MPTTRPRYTFTDTGEVERMLDRAQRAWPEIDDRKQLLFQLARAGEETLDARDRDAEALRARQLAAMERVADLVDMELLLSDAAWR